MMSEEERKAYWEGLQALPTVEEKEAYWLDHVERMEQRALERGVSLPPRPKKLVPDREQVARPAAPYFYEIMTEEEREAYYEGLGKLTVLSERRAFIAGHVLRMQARGRARGVSLPSAADWAYVFEGRAPAKAVAPEDDAAEPGEGEVETYEESEDQGEEDE
jgi:hypothetical protein